MSEVLFESRIRDRNEITIPVSVRKFLNLSPGDFIRFENIDGHICICKSVTHKVNHSCGGGNGTQV